MFTLYIKAPFQSTFSVKTNCKSLASVLQLWFGRYISFSEKPADFSIRATFQKNTYKIQASDFNCTTKAPLHVIHDYIFEHVRYDNSVLALHGAAVSWNGSAYLFLAATTGGKSTLAAYLSAKGFGYLTDDCILLDRNTLHIHPYSKPIHLRPGGYQVLEKYGCAPACTCSGTASDRRFIYTPENTVDTALPLAHIYFIKRTEHENQTMAMDTTERIFELMKAPAVVYPINGEYLKLLASISGIPCSRLQYSSLNYITDTIKKERN